MSRPIVALATCDLWPEAGRGLRLLITALEARGLEVAVLPWQTEDQAPFLKAPLILPLCVWDYARSPEAFRFWVRSLAAEGAPFANAPELMLWNMDKAYLTDLAAKGLPTPPSLLLEDPSAEDLAAHMETRGWPSAVLKPAIGQSGNGVQHFELAERAFWPEPPRGGLILQPWLPEILSAGETSLIFLEGCFSHAVLRAPAEGEWRANSQYGVRVSPVEPPPGAVELGLRALSLLPHRPFYARVDGLARREGFLLTELELIEPALFFDLHPEAAENAADRVTAKIRDPG